jgi:hypothetical protein
MRFWMKPQRGVSDLGAIVDGRHNCGMATSRTRVLGHLSITTAALVVVALLTFGAGCGNPDANAGYTPEDRATQFARALNEEFGEDPTAEVHCEFAYQEGGGGAEWYDCRPGGMIACSAETTKEPLQGDWHRERLVWGDCGAD